MQVIAVNVPAGWHLTNGRVYDVSPVIEWEERNSRADNNLKMCVFADDGYWRLFTPQFFRPLTSQESRYQAPAPR